jgi:hypothetical protein
MGHFMNRLYKICSIIYRIILAFLIPFLFFIVELSHNKNYSPIFFLIIAAIALTLLLLTFFQNTDKHRKTWTPLLRYVVMVLVLISIIAETSILYQMYPYLDFGLLSMVFLVGFYFSTIIVFVGLWKDHL